MLGGPLDTCAFCARDIQGTGFVTQSGPCDVDLLHRLPGRPGACLGACSVPVTACEQREPPGTPSGQRGEGSGLFSVKK